MQAFFSLAFFCCLTNKCCFSTSLSTLGSAPPSTPPEVWIKDNEIPCFSSRFCVSRGFAAHIPPFGSPSVERQGLDKHSPTANAFSLFFLGKQQGLAKRRQNSEQEGRHESWFCNFLTEWSWAKHHLPESQFPFLSNGLVKPTKSHGCWEKLCE